jgi:type III secretion protein D
MYELRVLSGLHRGATLPLDDNPHVIGASDDADVVLVDPGIEEKHASLTLTGSGWLISALDGELRTADSNQPQTSLELQPGEFARLGNIWLTVVEQDARWENPPPEPIDVQLEAAPPEQEQGEEGNEFGEEPGEQSGEEALDEADGVMSLAELTGDADDDEKAAASADAGTADEAAEDADDNEPEEKGQSLGQRLRGRRVVYIPLAVATVLSAAAAYAITSKPETAMSSKKLAEQAQLAPRPVNPEVPKPADKRVAAKPVDKTVAAAFNAVNTDPDAERPLTGEELRKAFRKRLTDADLLKRFDLQLQNEHWTMQAVLDEEENSRFERILAGFMKQHNITFPVHAKVGNPEVMLPFKIRQVITGANASVVTQEGERLYIGDEYRGVRLVAVNGNQLTFGGKRKIEVKW